MIMKYFESLRIKMTEFFRNYLEKAAPYFGFVRNSLFQRWMIAVVLCLILALIMAPELNFSKPQFRIGMIAPKNIKADFAFLVEDPQAAEEKKSRTRKISILFTITTVRLPIISKKDRQGFFSCRGAIQQCP